MNERRFESRFLCADLVRVDWMSAEDKSRSAEAVLEDVSALGLGVQVEEQIPLGTPVTISVGEVRFTGYVSYCFYMDYGYFVGVRLSDESQWSSSVFEPRHLTNLEELGLESMAGGTIH